MKKILLTLIFIPTISWGQSVALVEFISSEVIKHPSTNGCGYLDWMYCPNEPDSTCNVMKLTFKEWNIGAPDMNESKVVRKLVLHYQLELEEDYVYIFPWNTLKGQLFYIEYELDSQFIRIVHN